MSWLTFDDEEEPYGEYADHRVRERPNPKANRPRTKIRPEHEDAVIGVVTAVDRGRYALRIETDGEERVITAARARELRRTSIVTGDRVRVVGNVSGDEGTLARIVGVNPRTTLLRRSADDTDRVERVIVANADQLLIVVAAANPEPRVRLVDRYLVAAYDAGITPMICVTKTDVADPEPFIEHFAGLGIRVFRSNPREVPLDELRTALAGQETVFVGHSGVGKSTLINALVPTAERATGHVNEVTGRGRHTSSSTVALPLPDASGHVGTHSGWVIDTPGVRSFGLGHVTTDGILRGFTDLHAVIQNCPRGCTHLAGSPDCELDAAVASGALGPVGALRVDSLRRLLASSAPVG